MGRYSRSRSRSRDRSREKIEDEGFRVHVADLGVDCSQRELQKAFDKFGDLKEVWLARNPPCFAFIVFKHKADAEESIKEMNGRVVCGSRIRVNWARPRTRGRNKMDSNLRCYQCGERGHFSRDCRNGSGRSRGYRDDDRRRERRRSRSRSGRRHRRSYSRSKSRSRSRRDSRERRNGDSKKRSRSRSPSRSRDERRKRDSSKSKSRSRSVGREDRSRSRKRSRSRSEDRAENGHSEHGMNGSPAKRNSRSRSREIRSGSRDRDANKELEPEADKYDPTNDDRVSVNGHDDDNVVTGDYQSHIEDE